MDSYNQFSHGFDRVHDPCGAIRPSRLGADQLAIMTMEIMSRMLQKNALVVAEEMISIFHQVHDKT